MYEFMKGAFYFMCGTGCVYISTVLVTTTIKSIKEVVKEHKQPTNK